MKRTVANVLAALGAVALVFLAWGMSNADTVDADGEGPAVQMTLAEKPRDLVIISVDTLRADRLGSYGYEKASTPNLDDLGLSGIVFEDATVPIPRTTPALASLVTGLSPENHGSREVNEPMHIERGQTLAEVLKAQGYQTIGVSSNGAASERQHFERGFDHFLDRYGDRRSRTKNRKRSGSGPDVGRDGGDVSEKALALFAKVDPKKPLFMWVHYVDPHWTYGPPTRFNPPEGKKCKALQERLRKDEIELGSLIVNHDNMAADAYEDCSALYDSEVSYSDLQVGKMIEALRKSGRYQHALIVFTSDHGEAMGEENYWYDHGSSLNDGNMRVPLIISGPGVPKQKRDRSVTRMEDLMPTLLSALEVPRETWPEMDGKDFSWRWREAAELPHSPVKYAVAESGSTVRVMANSFLVSGHVGDRHCINGERYSLCQEHRKGDVVYYDRLKDPFFKHPLSAPPPTSEDLLTGLSVWKPETARSRAVRTSNFKLVEYPRLTGGYRRALYDLNEDPRETTDVQDEHPKLVGELQQVLDRWTQGLPLYEARERAPEEIEALRALGYIQ